MKKLSLLAVSFVSCFAAQNYDLTLIHDTLKPDISQNIVGSIVNSIKTYQNEKHYTSARIEQEEAKVACPFVMVNNNIRPKGILDFVQAVIFNIQQNRTPTLTEQSILRTFPLHANQDKYAPAFISALNQTIEKYLN